MPEIGYALSSEEASPRQLVDNARLAEEHGFGFGLISDHYLPWTDRQGQSPFAWTVIGAIAQATRRFRLGTGVTCPIIRYDPAILAQAVATACSLMPGRFFLGVGTGERLNEHVLGDKWPEYEVRSAMLEEAVQVMRELWKGDWTSFYGSFYSVENAKLYSLPDRTPEVFLAAGGPDAAELAGRIGDGLISTMPKREIVEAFQAAGGAGKPTIGQLTVCWAADEATARKTAAEWWPTIAIRGEASQELALPRHFEQLTSDVSGDEIAASIPCGPDVDRHLESIQQYADAGYDMVYVHQVGPEQEGFMRFYEREILPRFSRAGVAR